MIISSAAQAEVVILDKIVITGEKIDKSIKDTTSAVTVFTEEKLESGQTKQARDLATQAPNVIADSFGNISMRGVSGGGAATGGTALMTGARARVATVVDGTTQDWSGYNFAPTNLWDTEQVEILRGPQSTTQGATAIGGAIVINTNDPTFESEAAVRAGVERYDNGNLMYNVAAMSSGTLVEDELAYRIAIDKSQGEGWLNYDTSGFTGDLPNLSKSESLNLRGKLLWEPTSIPKLSAKLTVTKLKNEGEHANFASNTDEGITTQTLTVADSGGAISRMQDSTEDGVSTDINYEISPGITNNLHISQIDSDIYADGYGSFQGQTTHTYDIEQTTTALENRIIFNQEGSKLTGVVGLFASEKDSVIDATQGVINIDTDYTNTTTAIYGDVTYSTSLKTKLNAGLRIENEDNTKSNSSVFGSTSNSLTNEKTNDTHTLPKISISHAITNSTTLGASVRKGYSSGGVYVNFSGNIVSYDSEEVTSYELSSRSDLGEGTTLTTSIFYNDYNDYQALSGDLVNVDEATTYGIEIEATTWATEDLELWGSIGLLRSEVDKYNTTSSYEGNELSSAPETNAAIGFTQLIGDDWSVGADITYVGTFYTDLANSSDKVAGNHTITNVNAQYTIGDLTINSYIKNLTNEDAVYYIDGSLAAVGQTQTVGISALYRM